MHDLSILEQSRPEILKAELAAYLSVIGRLDERFLKSVSDRHANAEGVRNYYCARIVKPDSGMLEESNSIDAVASEPSDGPAREAARRWRNFTKGYGPFNEDQEERLRSISVSVLDESWTLGDLLTLSHSQFFSHPSPYERKPELPSLRRNKEMRLPALLCLSHGLCSIAKGGSADVRNDEATKEETRRKNEYKPELEQQQKSTVFGNSVPLNQNPGAWKEDLLEAGLRYASAPSAEQRRAFLEKARECLVHGVQDTIFPNHDVTLWDYAASIAAYFKACLAKAVLDNRWPKMSSDAAELQWRLLKFRFDGLGFLTSVHRIPDLLARRALLENALDCVRHTLEWEYPLANEIYRDENGSVFLFPAGFELDELRSGPGDLAARLRRDLQGTGLYGDSTLALEGEIAIEPLLGDPKPGDSILMGEQLREACASFAAPEAVQEAWRDVRDREVCTVCGLRPQEAAGKAKRRSVCEVCERRRDERSKRWAGVRTHNVGVDCEGTDEEGARTIWTDEAADENGRLALVAAAFDLQDWLSGRAIQTLAGSAMSRGRPLSRWPSFARIYGVYQAASRFWEEAQFQIQRLLQFEPSGPDRENEQRLRLILNVERISNGLVAGHVYESAAQSPSLSLVRAPDTNGTPGRLLSATNLRALARRMNARSEQRDTQKHALDFILSVLRASPLSLFEARDDAKNPQAGGYGSPRERKCTVESWSATEPQPYTPYIPILKEPRLFFAIVPGNRALEAAAFIEQKYSTEMARVRDKLALRLGLVFFDRSTPVAAVIQAGSKLVSDIRLNKPWRSAWTVARSSPGVLEFAEGDCLLGNCVVQNRAESRVRWTIPTELGPSPDRWYPFFRLEEYPESRRNWDPRQFLWNIGSDSRSLEGPLAVSLEGLVAGDRVRVQPSTFDYEYLDAAGRRFEIAYDERGRRLSPERTTRPYLLEEFATLRRIWELLGALSENQMYGVTAVIEEKRKAWGLRRGDIRDDTFEALVNNVLATAQWDARSPWAEKSEADRALLVRVAITGVLDDVTDLYLRILKVRHPGKKDRNTGAPDTTGATA